MTDHAFLREAIQLAAEHSADGRHGPFGAVVVRDGQVVGRGWNRVVATPDPTAHAEVTAIRDACRSLETHDLAGATIYCSCEPCPMCLSAIYWARISRVVFAASGADARDAGFADLGILGEVSLPPQERRIRQAQALREEGQAVLRAWRENPKRVPY
jgi:tRNA(Arg) A34 adenosine deaminase TadA